MSKPFIIEVHTIIEATKWDRAYKNIIEMLKNIKPDEYSLIPLYATYDLEDTELRICLKFDDPPKVEQFINERIRKVDGVYATRARLTLNGKIFQQGVSYILNKESELPYSCHIFLKTKPGLDKSVWDSLCKLKGSGGVLPTWIFRDFYEYDRDITLRLVGSSEKAVREYIEKHLNWIEGIQTWKFKFMYNNVQFLKNDELLALAQKWFS